MSPQTEGGPKDRFNSLDVLALVRELKSFEGGRVDKVFDAPASGFILSLRAPARPHHELVLVPGRYGALLSGRAERSEELSSGARELRRLLSGAVFRRVEDSRGERFVELEFGRREEPVPLRILAEFFGEGNLVVAAGDKVDWALHSRTWAHRQVRRGAPYSKPPSRLNPWTMGAAAFANELARSRTNRITTLAARLAFGGPLAEELLARGGISGEDPAPLNSEDTAGKIREALDGLLAEVGDRPRGFLYVDADEAIGQIEVAPVRLHRWRDSSHVSLTELDTFSEAADLYFRNWLAQAEAGVDEDERRRDALQRQKNQQLAAIEALANEAKERHSDAEAIYAHYEAAARAIEASRGPEGGEELIEVSLGGRKVTLWPRAGVEGSAQRHYAETKKVRVKLTGARTALQETEARIDEAGRETRERRAKEPPPRGGRRTAWYERFRWFISSEEVLVIAGRDASTNDLLVRRYLHSGDLFMHADVQGAASVVIRHPDTGRAPPSEATLSEAAQFAVAFSKAWRAGLATSSAFWVTPDQVSKAGMSGEFVPKGAWVVHGRKNVIGDVPLELGIGEIDVASTSRWMVAPPRAFQGRGRLRFLLTPGNEGERAERELDLAKELGVNRSLLQSLLPAGGITIRRA